MESERLREVWAQKIIPVVLRRDGKGEKLRVRLPDAEDNKEWLDGIGKSHPDWIASGIYWELPKSWFSDFVNTALKRYGKLYVIQPHREQEKCSTACMNATRHECQCSCMGEYHGSGNDGSWFEVSETFATRWNDRALACRLMCRK